MNEKPNKPLNLKLYLILSIFPLISLIPLRTLKKMRIMIFINVILSFSGYGASFLVTRFGWSDMEFATFVSNILVYIASTIIQCVLVTKWVKEYNSQVKLTS